MSINGNLSHSTKEIFLKKTYCKLYCYVKQITKENKIRMCFSCCGGSNALRQQERRFSDSKTSAFCISILVYAMFFNVTVVHYVVRYSAWLSIRYFKKHITMPMHCYDLALFFLLPLYFTEILP